MQDSSFTASGPMCLRHFLNHIKTNALLHQQPQQEPATPCDQSVRRQPTRSAKRKVNYRDNDDFEDCLASQKRARLKLDLIPETSRESQILALVGRHISSSAKFKKCPFASRPMAFNSMTASPSAEAPKIASPRRKVKLLRRAPMADMQLTRARMTKAAQPDLTRLLTVSHQGLVFGIDTCKSPRFIPVSA